MYTIIPAYTIIYTPLYAFLRPYTPTYTLIQPYTLLTHPIITHQPPLSPPYQSSLSFSPITTLPTSPLNPPSQPPLSIPPITTTFTFQDHVASGVKLTCKDTFLTKSEFQQLVFVAVCGLPGTEIVTHLEHMVTPPPAIRKPRELWTGKQVISSILQHTCRKPLPQLHLDGKTRTPPTAFGAEHQEHVIVFRHGELLSGVIDKASIGNVSLGIVHAVYELYGAELAGKILTAFGRVFTYHLQDAGNENNSVRSV